jgi:hypothetical protein
MAATKRHNDVVVSEWQTSAVTEIRKSICSPFRKKWMQFIFNMAYLHLCWTSVKIDLHLCDTATIWLTSFANRYKYTYFFFIHITIWLTFFYRYHDDMYPHPPPNSKSSDHNFPIYFDILLYITFSTGYKRFNNMSFHWKTAIFLKLCLIIGSLELTIGLLCIIFWKIRHKNIE